MGGLGDFTLSIDGDGDGNGDGDISKVLVWITEIGCEIVVFGGDPNRIGGRGHYSGIVPYK